MGLDPLRLRQRGHDPQQCFAREDDGPFRHGVDVALESRPGDLVHDLGGRRREKPASCRISAICSGSNASASRSPIDLLEPGKHQIGPCPAASCERTARTSPSGPPFRRRDSRPSSSARTGPSAGRVPAGSARERQEARVHRGSPARFGRSNRSSTSSVDFAVRLPPEGSMSSNTGRLKVVATARQGSNRPAARLSSASSALSCADDGRVEQRPGPVPGGPQQSAQSSACGSIDDARRRAQVKRHRRPGEDPKRLDGSWEGRERLTSMPSSASRSAPSKPGRPLFHGWKRADRHGSRKPLPADTPASPGRTASRSCSRPARVALSASILRQATADGAAQENPSKGLQRQPEPRIGMVKRRQDQEDQPAAIKQEHALAVHDPRTRRTHGSQTSGTHHARSGVTRSAAAARASRMISGEPRARQALLDADDQNSRGRRPARAAASQTGPPESARACASWAAR